MRRRTTFPLTLTLAFAWLTLGQPVAAEAPSISPTAVAAQIADVIEYPSAHGLDREPIESAELHLVYAAVANAPLWQLGPQAEARRQILETALDTSPDQGMTAHGLHTGLLARLAHPTTARDVAERDVLLTDAALRYATALRRGATRAEALGPDWHLASDAFDPARALSDALRAGRLADFLSSLPPPNPQYAALVAALRRYRSLGRQGGWTAIPGGGEVKLDGHDPRLPTLANRLAAENYLPAGNDSVDAGRLGPAVRLFQARHGLDPDARVGARTLAALNVTAEERANQIAANLERWRHLPRQFGTRYIVVNLADASLDLIEHGTSSFRTRVIVGDVRHPSPTIQATVTGITFNPPWNVPPSIAVREMLPRLKRDPRYLAANDIVIVGRGADDPFGLRVNWRSISGRGFPFRLQQRPGANNSLGVLKLEMPNPWDVYLHDTPAKALFARAQRGFSHGCIRVQQPAELARRLLADSGWDADAIAQGIASGVTRTVALHRPIPVYLLYWTAFVDSEGAVNFRGDLYGRDAPIERALDLERVPANATELQKTASCSQPRAGLASQIN